MIKNLHKIILGIALTISLTMQAQTPACQELFISEVVFAQDNIALSGTSSLINSYAVEVFNPKGTNADLTGYYIKLANGGANDININLSGNIDAHGTFVLGFAGADVTVQQLSDMLSSNLNFNEKTRLELWSPNGIIDRIGEANLTQADIINITQAIADPVNYLNTLNIDLSSLENFTIRRRQTETGGDPLFVQPSLKWDVAPNGDITGLGNYNNVCSEVEGPTLYTLFSFAPTTDLTDETIIDVNTKKINLNAGDNIKIGVRANNTSNVFQTYSVDIDAQYSNYCTPLTSNSAASFAEITAVNGLITFNHNLLHTFELYPVNTANFFFSGTKSITIELSNPQNGSLGANSCIELIVDFTTDINTIPLNKQISLFPTVAENDLFLNNYDANINLKNIQIYDVNGKTVASINKFNANKIDVSNLQAGYYFIQFSNSKESITKSFVKK